MDLVWFGNNCLSNLQSKLCMQFKPTYVASGTYFLPVVQVASRRHNMLLIYLLCCALASSVKLCLKLCHVGTNTFILLSENLLMLICYSQMLHIILQLDSYLCPKIACFSKFGWKQACFFPEVVPQVGSKKFPAKLSFYCGGDKLLQTWQNEYMAQKISYIMAILSVQWFSSRLRMLIVLHLTSSGT